ncbi:MAG: sensor histidine kinase [Microlunatus sp.]
MSQTQSYDPHPYRAQSYSSYSDGAYSVPYGEHNAPNFLYEPTPGADLDHGPEPQDDRTSLMLRNAGRNFLAICGLFFVSLAAFIIGVTLFSLGVSLVVIVIGLFILVGALVAAGATARATKGLLAYAGVDLPATVYPSSTGGGFRVLSRLRDPQSWRDLIYTVVGFVLSTFSFSVAVSWVFGGLGGVLYWFWSRYLPEDNQGLPYLLGFPGRFADVFFNSALGLILILSTPAVLQGLVRLHAAVARGLLVDESSALRAQVSHLTTSRTAAGDAETHTLRKLERDLHDGPQQRLVRLGMDISSAQRRLATDPEQAQRLLDEAYEQTQEALSEIRQLSRGIAPPILAEQGLPAAITALAARNSVPTSVDVGDVRLSDAAQNAAYFAVAEALTNMEKHSGATRCSVEIHPLGGVVVAVVTDNGVGGASLSRGHGLAGLADRLAGVDGSLTITSPAGGPTQITATIPSSL